MTSKEKRVPRICAGFVFHKVWVLNDYIYRNRRLILAVGLSYDVMSYIYSIKSIKRNRECRPVLACFRCSSGVLTGSLVWFRCVLSVADHF